LGRRRALERSRPPRTTRKGKSFALDKKIVLWRAILATRPEGWKPGDRAPFGSIARAHQEAKAACKTLGLAAPRYGTVYALWHRGVPAAEVLRALKAE